MRAVIERATDQVIDAQRPVIESLDSWEALSAWRDLFLQVQEGKRCHGGVRDWVARELAGRN